MLNLSKMKLLIALLLFVGSLAALGVGAGSRPASTQTNPDLALPQEKHLRNVRQLTFGGENAEAYFSSDGKKLIFQSTRDGRTCDDWHAFLRRVQVFPIAVLVDAVVRDFASSRMDSSIAVVAVASAEPPRESVAVPVSEHLQSPQGRSREHSMFEDEGSYGVVASTHGSDGRAQGERSREHDLERGREARDE